LKEKYSIIWKQVSKCYWISQRVRRNARTVEDLVEELRTDRYRRAREKMIWRMGEARETAEETEKSE